MPDAHRLSPGKRFGLFAAIILLGLVTLYLTVRQGLKLTPEGFKGYVASLGRRGPALYVGLFAIRPFFMISSIALFTAGGLAFGPVWGPLYALGGAALGGSLAFGIARLLGREFVLNQIHKLERGFLQDKIGRSAALAQNTSFDVSVVFSLSLIPLMPITLINYGAGLSPIRYRHYLAAHILGLTPRAFAIGFFGSTLLEIGSARFLMAALVLLLLALLTLLFKDKSPAPTSPDNNP